MAHMAQNGIGSRRLRLGLLQDPAKLCPRRRGISIVQTDCGSKVIGYRGQRFGHFINACCKSLSRVAML